MATIGLLFGSFNPIHTGHLVIAEYFASQGGCDHVQLIVSPHNPLKPADDLADARHRLAMARIAVRGNHHISVNAIEFSMPLPSYTIDTLRQLSTRYPEHAFRLIIGSDNFARFHEWKHWQQILKDFHILAYRRPGYAHPDLEGHAHVSMYDHIPLLHISATYIRECVGRGVSVRYLVPDGVRRYIEKEQLYIYI